MKHHLAKEKAKAYGQNQIDNAAPVSNAANNFYKYAAKSGQKVNAAPAKQVLSDQNPAYKITEEKGSKQKLSPSAQKQIAAGTKDISKPARAEMHAEKLAYYKARHEKTGGKTVYNNKNTGEQFTYDGMNKTVL